MLDALNHVASDVSRRSVPATILVGDVVLHAGLAVELQLLRVDGRAQVRVNLTRILVVIVVLGVVDVFNGQVNTQSLLGHLELFGSISVGQEAESHDLDKTRSDTLLKGAEVATHDVEDSLARELLERSDVHSLTVVAVQTWR